jgi:glycosyltransferase involved in cell wall biosynthesis
MPAISVILPTYNSAHFISESIRSVLAQTFEDWELLIINDGSTDHTEETASQYCTQDIRVKLISRENCGVSRSRNFGVSLARGELIAFLDADDRWLPNKLATHVKYMNASPDIGISFARVEFLQLNGKATGKLVNSQLTGLKPEDFLYTNPTVTVSNIVVKRSLFKELQGFDETINYSEDMEFLFRCSSYKEFQIEGINEVLVQYRIHTSGLSSTLDKMEQGWHMFINKAMLLNPDLIEQHYQSAYASQLQYLARQTLRLGFSEKLGITFINRAIRTDWQLIIGRPRSLAILLLLYVRYVASFFKLQIRL